jgi:hypothetical protein
MGHLAQGRAPVVQTSARPVAFGPAKGAHDGCEWNPDAARGSEVADRHFLSTRAEVLVGGRGDGTIRYRLCRRCAALPLFCSRRQEPIRRERVAS